MLTRDTLFELWKKNHRRDEFGEWFLLRRNGVLKLIRDEDPDLHDRLKKARAHYRRVRKGPLHRGRTRPSAGNMFTTDRELYLELSKSVREQLNALIKPHVKRWKEEEEAERRRKLKEDAPNKLIAYAVMIKNKFYGGEYSGRPNIYWNKEKVVKMAKGIPNGDAYNVRVVELEIKVTDRLLDLNT